MRIKLSPKAMTLLEDLSKRTGTPCEELLPKALVLFGTAVHARLEGGTTYIAPAGTEFEGSGFVEVGGLLVQESSPVSLESVTGFAEKAHEGQTYGEGVPYLKHLRDVVQVLDRFGFRRSGAFLDPRNRSDRLVAGGWLHDTLEDTETAYEDLRDHFGCEIAHLVEGVTNAAGRNRKERSRKTYPKIRRSVESVILKLADRIANVESCRATTQSSLLQMYKKEWPAFRATLYRANECEEMWKTLTRLLEGK